MRQGRAVIRFPLVLLTLSAVLIALRYWRVPLLVFSTFSKLKQKYSRSQGRISAFPFLHVYSALHCPESQVPSFHFRAFLIFDAGLGRPRRLPNSSMELLSIRQVVIPSWYLTWTLLGARFPPPKTENAVHCPYYIAWKLITSVFNDGADVLTQGFSKAAISKRKVRHVVGESYIYKLHSPFLTLFSSFRINFLWHSSPNTTLAQYHFTFTAQLLPFENMKTTSFAATALLVATTALATPIDYTPPGGVSHLFFHFNELLLTAASGSLLSTPPVLARTSHTIHHHPEVGSLSPTQQVQAAVVLAEVLKNPTVHSHSQAHTTSQLLDQRFETARLQRQDQLMLLDSSATASMLL